MNGQATKLHAVESDLIDGDPGEEIDRRGVAQRIVGKRRPARLRDRRTIAPTGRTKKDPQRLGHGSAECVASHHQHHRDQRRGCLQAIAGPFRELPIEVTDQRLRSGHDLASRLGDKQSMGRLEDGLDKARTLIKKGR